MMQGFSERGEVDDVELFADALVGYRAWDLRLWGKSPTGPLAKPRIGSPNTGTLPTIGALHGVFQQTYRWGSGTNTAVCFMRGGPLQQQGAFSTYPGIGDETLARIYRSHHEDRTIPPGCACGFWAYVPHEMEPALAHRSERIWGVVHAWGNIVVGTRGFRAQHARIVALAFPVQTGFDLSHPATRSSYQFYNVRGRLAESNDEVVDALRTNYPDVWLFDDVNAMEAAHPASDLTPFYAEEKA